MLTPLQIVTGSSISRLKEPRYWSSCPSETTNVVLKGKFQYEFLRRRIYGTLVWKPGLSFLKLCGSQAKFIYSFKILKVLKLRKYACLGVCDDCYRFCCYFLLYFRIGGSTRHYCNQLEKWMEQSKIYTEKKRTLVTCCWKTEEILKLQKCHHFKLYCAISLFPRTFNQCRKNLTGEAAKNHSE